MVNRYSPILPRPTIPTVEFFKLTPSGLNGFHVCHFPLESKIIKIIITHTVVN